LLKSPHAAPLTVEQMDEAAAKLVRDKHAPSHAVPQVGWPMIGIDTNVLLRLWLNDDPAQNTRIDALLAGRVK
jgi:hypothetical protein